MNEKQPNPELTQELLETVDKSEEYVKDGDIWCKKCNTKRTCFAFNRKVRCICQCQAEERDRQADEEKRKARLKRVEQLKASSLMGERYKHVSFNSTDVYSDDFRTIFNRCRRYCEVADQVLNRGIGIYLYGTSGTGKSHLTACMANELIDNYYSVLFTSITEISKMIRGTYGRRGDSEQKFLDQLGNIDFLFIDDFGTELVTKDDQDLWLQEKVYEIVNRRYNNNRPIIFTSNYSLNELGVERGLSSKTIDRIAETCEPMVLKGQSYRQRARARARTSTIF